MREKDASDDYAVLKNKKPSILQAERVEPLATKSAEKLNTVRKKTESTSYPTEVFKINNTRVVYVTAGSSLFATASKYKISYKKLLKYNDLNKTDILIEGRLIYLEKKSKQGNNDHHVVSHAKT